MAAVPSRGRGFVFDLEEPAWKVALLGHHNLETLALSPDGKWVAGTGFGPDLSLWDARTGERVKVLPVGGRSHPLFSPDGRWLTAGDSNGGRFWEVGSWQPDRPILPKELNNYAQVKAYARDGKMAAVLLAPGSVVKLIDPATGREFATLEPPDPQSTKHLYFSPDGSQLAVACETHVIQVWDLRLIRRQLEEIGLD